MRLPAQILDRRDVVAGVDEPLGQLGDPSQLVPRSLQVLVPEAGGEPEVGVLAHGLQDIASFIFDLMMDPVPTGPVGLCATCRWVRTVSNRRGSVFYRCGRADDDPTFPRYPALPV